MKSVHSDEYQSIIYNKYHQHCEGLIRESEFLKEEWFSEQRHGLQVLLDDGVHDDLENYLNVGGVSRCGEVVVDEFTGRRVERHKHWGDEPGSSIHVTVSSCEQKQELSLFDTVKNSFILLQLKTTSILNIF